MCFWLSRKEKARKWEGNVNVASRIKMIVLQNLDSSSLECAFTYTQTQTCQTHAHVLKTSITSTYSSNSFKSVFFTLNQPSTQLF
jgi:hypothetical protein